MTDEDSLFQHGAVLFLEQVLTAVEESDQDILDADLVDGVLTLELEDGRVFLLNRHQPLRQIWLSSPLSGASHYAFDADRAAWVSTRGDDDLSLVLKRELLAAAGLDLRLNP